MREDEQMGSGTADSRKSSGTSWRHVKRENESFGHAICFTQALGKTRCLVARVGMSVRKHNRRLYLCTIDKGIQLL